MIELPRSLVWNHVREWRARRLQRANDGGFILLESLVAISVISVIMAAFTTFFVNAISSTTHQRARQAAAQIADSGVETIRALPVSDLVIGHDSITSIVATQTVNNVVYDIHDDLAACVIPTPVSGSST